MRFLSVRDLRGKSGEVWKALPLEKEMVITSNGHPVAILSAIDEGNFEKSLASIRQARAASAVATLQSRSSEEGRDGMGLDEIDAEIAAVRKGRPCNAN
jgi:antitoxin (DNA-binding transcriptional repressor) of toxin-antitoxin stability system